MRSLVRLVDNVGRAVVFALNWAAWRIAPSRNGKP